jgi:predicted DNA-binding protein (MmcQ/YjbR family)
VTPSDAIVPHSGAGLTIDEYNAFCRALPATSHIVQWGGAHVWKVGGTVEGRTVAKVFAIAWDDTGPREAIGHARARPGDELLVTFKVSDLSYDLMRAQPGLRPAPYLASRGMTWIQRTDTRTLDDAGLKDYLAESHRIVAGGLPTRIREVIGMDRKRTSPRTSSPRDARRKIGRDTGRADLASPGFDRSRTDAGRTDDLNRTARHAAVDLRKRSQP